MKNAPGRDKSWASLEDCYFPSAYCTKLALCQRCSRIAAKDGDDGEVVESGSASERVDGQRRLHKGGNSQKEKTDLK